MLSSVKKRVRSLRERDDEGAILILALLFILVIGLAIAGMLTHTTSGLTKAAVVRQYNTKRYATDAGLRYGVQRLRSSPELCTLGQTALQPPASFLTSDGNAAATNQALPTLKLGCTVDQNQPTLGANGFAIITHDQSASGITGGLNSAPIPVSGPVFMASNPPTNQLYMKVQNGDVYTQTPSTGGCPSSAPGNVSIGSGYSWGCLPSPPDAPTAQMPDVVTPQLPNSTTLTDIKSRPRTGYVTTTAGNCYVFAPGYYKNLTLNLSQGNGNTLGKNYFASGLYYFENVNIVVKNAQLYGGLPHSGATYLGNSYDETSDLTAFSNSFKSDCGSDDVAKTAAGANSGISGSGVEFILGGTSQFVVDNNKGYAELYARYPADNTSPSSTAEGTPGTSIMTVTSGAPAGWTPVAQDFTNECLGENNYNGGGGGGGSNMGLSVHGLVYTPNCAMDIRDNLDVGRFSGGLDVGRLTISTSNNITNFKISVAQQTVPRGMTLTSCATLSSNANACTTGSTSASSNVGRDVYGSVHLVIDNAHQTVSVTSWRTD